MAETIVVSCGHGEGKAALVRPSTTKTTTTMVGGKKHGFSLPNGGHMLVHRIGSIPVSVHNSSDRPASISITKPHASKIKLGAGKTHQLGAHEELNISI